MLKPLLTIFTPTYNRAYTLHLCYESLKRQTVKNFIWLIIDDGSNDNTKQLVDSWIKEDLIKIRYHYQQNQGMHGAHNTAYERIDTELNVCIDSDDYMSDNAVEKIVNFWLANGSEQYAGIVALDASPDGNLIGSPLPEYLKASPLYELYAKHAVRGDKKLIYRTEVINRYPKYPLFPGEKYCPLSYKYLLVDQDYPLLLMNEIVCYVEYRPDGSSLNMMKQYYRNPRGFAFFRKEAMKLAPTVKERIREAIHYVASNMLIMNGRYIKESPRKGITLIATPFGLMLSYYIKFVNRRMRKQA